MQPYKNLVRLRFDKPASPFLLMARQNASFPHGFAAFVSFVVIRCHLSAAARHVSIMCVCDLLAIFCG